MSQREKKSREMRVKNDKKALIFSHAVRGKKRARREKIILPPSKKEIGRRLDIPTHRLIKTKSVPPEDKPDLADIRNKSAESRLKRGPKAATTSSFL